MAELTASTASSAHALESVREQNASLQDQLVVTIAECRQLLAVATDHDRELTGKFVLRCGPFRPLHLNLFAGVLTHNCLLLHLLAQSCRRCGIGGRSTLPG